MVVFLLSWWFSGMSLGIFSRNCLFGKERHFFSTSPVFLEGSMWDVSLVTFLHMFFDWSFSEFILFWHAFRFLPHLSQVHVCFSISKYCSSSWNSFHLWVVFSVVVSTALFSPIISFLDSWQFLYHLMIHLLKLYFRHQWTFIIDEKMYG